MARAHFQPTYTARLTPSPQTRRLLLEPLRLEDAQQVQPIFADWHVVQFLTRAVPWPFPADGVNTYYRDVALPAVARGEEWHWTLRLRSAAEEIVGAISLSVGEVNRGFWLGRRWQQQGYMTEACRVTNRFWFGQLGNDRLRVPKAVANEGSRRISQREGMTVVERGRKAFVCGECDFECWQLTREQWLAHEKGGAPKSAAR